VEGRWAGKIELPLAVGDVLTPDKISAALTTLRREITKAPVSISGLSSKGEISVLYIAVDYDTDSLHHNVGVTFRPYYVDISLVEIGDNVLPIPRSALPTFYENVPKPLLALNPSFGISQDRAFGTSFFGGMRADLLTLFRPATNADAAPEREHLELRADGTKSIDETFYRSDISLRYSLRQPAGFAEELSAYGNFNGVDEPLGDGNHQRLAGAGSFGAKLKLAPNTRLWLDAGYRRADDRFQPDDSTPRTNTSTNEQTGRGLFEMIPPSIHGFLRGAVWEEAGWQSGPSKSYQRIAARLGYEREIPLGLNRALGVELITGGGGAFGSVPDYARFFGGNAPNQFIYDNATSPSLLQMPTGPLIRSFGEGEARLADKHGRSLGGDAFWHANLNLSIPIPWLSRPLIPDQATGLLNNDGSPLTIKQLMTNQIDVTGPSMIRAALKQKGFTDEQANAQVKEILGEISPATHFIINQANLYAIKPLGMFDVAGMSGGGGRSETWLAAGGGVEIIVVTAKLEFGYMQTLSGPTFGSRGNAFVRLVFQNLF
jgi:hypothetical protein